MKKSITSKIEALLNAMYGDPLPEKIRTATNHKTSDGKEAEHMRCKDLPFEFIRLLL